MQRNDCKRQEEGGKSGGYMRECRVNGIDNVSREESMIEFTLEAREEGVRNKVRGGKGV